jgi:pantothenate kinase type III
MNLAIDIGNTNLKYGLFENNEPLEVFTGEEAIDVILATHKIENAILSKTGSNSSIEQKLKEKKHSIAFSFS